RTGGRVYVDFQALAITGATAGQHRQSNRGFGRSALRLHYFHHWSLWQVHLPLPSTEWSGPRPQPSPHLQGRWQDRHRVLAGPSRGAQGRTRDRRVSQTASTAQGICRGQCTDLPAAPTGTRHAVVAGKKTAEAIQQEVAREIDQLLRVIFSGRRKSGRFDLEAIEMAVRSAMHRAGATALSKLLRLPAPAADQLRLPCPCGLQAHYLGLRSKPLLTAVGQVELLRPYYLCPHCHSGQFPADGKVTTKSVEPTGEAIGADIAALEQREIGRAMQLDFPIVIGEPIPVLYVEMDGTGVPVVKKETAGRQGKIVGQPAHTREAKLGGVFTQTKSDDDGYAIRDLGSTTYVGAIETAEEFGKRLYLEAWKRGWSRAHKKVV